MKKLLFLVMLAFTLGITVNGQDGKDKMKKTSTVPQKVHNTFSKHKKHKGYKVKHKRGHHVKKHKVDYKHGNVKNKNH